MDTTHDERLARLNPRDREYIAGLPDAQREIVTSTITRYWKENGLRVRDPLPRLGLTEAATLRPVALGELIADRPVLLVFGSYTWPPFRRRSGDVEELHQRFADRASTYFVYVAEAHAVDEWQMDSNEGAGIRIAQHRTLEERVAEARAGARQLGLSMPVLVDGMDNAVSEAFAAWPERLYVLGTDGRIAFAGGPGPWEFEPELAAAALAELPER